MCVGVCGGFNALYMKHYNTQPNLITHYIFHSIPPPPLHPHMLTHTHTHNLTIMLIIIVNTVNSMLYTRGRKYAEKCVSDEKTKTKNFDAIAQTP